jgi:hypothetical protein
MTEPGDRVEAALRSAYAARNARPTAELRARLDAIPGEVAAGWSVRRRALGLVLGVTALAGATIAVLVAVRNLSRTAVPPPGVGSSTPFDPAHPNGGLAALSGVTFDAIWAVVYVSTALFVAVPLTWIAIAWVRGLGHAPKPTRPRPQLSRRRQLVNIVQGIATVTVVLIVQSAFRPPPLSPGSFAQLGLGLNEIRSDGVGLVDASIHGFLYTSDDAGPRGVFRVGPGGPLTYVVTVRNTWPIGIRLMGRWADSAARTDATEPTGTTPTGLGLLRDPSKDDGSIENTAQFSPVDLAPGAEVALVVTEVGRDCADPTRILPERRPYDTVSAPAIQFVYEAVGIEGIATVGLMQEVTVPSNCP